MTTSSCVHEWELHTEDTRIRVAVTNHSPTIVALGHPQDAWNWTARPSEIKLVATVGARGIFQETAWRYVDMVNHVSPDGKTVTLKFTNSSPNLQFDLSFIARPGPGPIELRMTVANRTDEDVRICRQESVDLTATAEKATTLWRFAKEASRSAPEGILKDTLVEGFDRTWSNEGHDDKALMAFAVLDSGGQHGLYVGYAWSFGRHRVRCEAENRIRIVEGLGDSFTFNLPAGKVYTVPSAFVGTYRGDWEDGSNRMKKWWFNHKMPAPMRTNPNEPLVKFGPPAYTPAKMFFQSWESKWNKCLNEKPLADWGVENVCLDWGWWENNQTWGMWDWAANTNQWPNGMNAGLAARDKKLGMILYCLVQDRYDLAVQRGRDRLKADFLEHMKRYAFDTFRSDMDPTGKGDYLRQEGFHEVLDYLWANSPGFRYENCSGGGGLKDFGTVQRCSTVPVTDTFDALSMRKAFYDSSYFFPSLQLQVNWWMGAFHKDGDMKDDDVERHKYGFRTTMLGASDCGDPFNELSAVRQAAYQDMLRLYRSRQRPLVREADVHHILPRPDGVHWDGLEYFHPPTGKGSVFLFKPSSTDGDSKTIVLRGLNPDATYALSFQDRPEQNARKTGSELMKEGIKVTLTGDVASEIIWID